jgi:putative ABC transport system permease protein
MNPPRVALTLLRWLLPRSLREPIAGDLEEEWRAGPSRSALHFWNLTLRSIASCWIDRLRRDPSRRLRHNDRGTGERHMQSLLQDLRYGSRLMWRNPAFTVAAVATLALGIGANSAIFSIVNVLSLMPLPYHDPARVAFVLGWDVQDDEIRFNLRQADFLDLQRQVKSFEALSAYTYVSANLTGSDIPDRVQAYRVTPNTFSLLGVPAALGRTFDESDAQQNRFDLAVISHGLWQRRFGSDSSIVGRRIVVNGNPYEVAGVMPAHFEYPVFNFKGDLWIPWQMSDSERGQPSASGSATLVARVRSGVSYAQAQAETDLVMRALADRYPDTNRGLGARVTEMGNLDDEQAGPAMLILLVTVAMVLLLACANVANLLLARGVARNRELAVRAAIGASRMRIGRQLIVEGVLLAIAGGTCGVMLAVVALEGVRALLPEALLTTLPNVAEIGVDMTTLGYTLLISLLTSVLFGVLPAWRASRERFEGGLKESASAGGSRATRRLRTALVISEVALATILLVTAGLLVRSYSGLLKVSPGFDPANVMTMAMTLPEYKYGDATKRRLFYEQLLDRVEQLPGVESAALVNVLPFSTYDRGTRIVVDGASTPEPGREPAVSYRIASERYHEVMRIPLLEGRFFDRRDTPDGARVAVVNQTAVEQYLGGCRAPRPGVPCGQSAIGRRLRMGSAEQSWLTVVGVIGDVHHSSVTRDPQPEVYVPISQSPVAMMMLATRTRTRPEDATAPIRAAVQAIDPAQPVYHVKTLEALVGDALLPSRASANIMALFSVLALLLAAIGIYGVVAYGVSQQTREFGIRMALGATPRDVLRGVLRSGTAMVGVGILLGLSGAVGVSRLLAGALHGVSPSDPLTYGAVIGMLATSGLVACAVPAWRASVTRPLNALRSD